MSEHDCLDADSVVSYSTAWNAGGQRIKGPDSGPVNILVGHAGDGRRGVIFHRHRLAALGSVAAGIGCPRSEERRVGIDCMSVGVGNHSKKRDGLVAKGISRFQLLNRTVYAKPELRERLVV